ncbi:MAG: Crp/Fnr family transcriptional regulator [Candidatus Bipolaricaulota bacterium]|nr:Crp/Fnr family transcriptional regulator [Candidatus Bipolaricaulota bacterium]MDW8030332.1 Crp/Fnr family transcriptional regulator [Candidatus Bipolaricaulota bacterium]
MEKQQGLCRRCVVRQECIFAEVGEEALHGRARWVRYSKRAMIFHEGEPAGGLYVLYQGKVMLFKHAPNGQRRIFDIVGPAGILGEEALLANSSYMLSAQALTQVHMLFITRMDMQHLCEEVSVQRRLWARLLQRLRRTQELLLEMRSLDSRERLVRLLTRLTVEHGSPCGPDGWVALDLPLTQAELAEIVGLSREAVSKHLSYFKEQGAIQVARCKLFINPSALVATWNESPVRKRSFMQIA